MPESVAHAIEIIHDTSINEVEREDAIHYLARHLDPEVIGQLTQVLDDDDFGVRWAAAQALTFAGAEALVPILRLLIAKGGSPEVREAAQHALRNNIDPQVRQQAKPVLEALRGPGADMATPMAAYELLHSL